jgi:hypothetical protein
MAYKKDDNGGQAASAPSASSSGGGKVTAGGSYSKSSASGSSGSAKASAKASTKVISKSSGAGSRDSSAHAAASADRAAAAGRGKVASFTPSVRGGSSGGGLGFSSAQGADPTQWGNASANYLGTDKDVWNKGADLPYDYEDRNLHYFDTDHDTNKSHLEKATEWNVNRSKYMLGQYWGSGKKQYESETARREDNSQWLKDAQIYHDWAEKHGYNDLANQWEEAYNDARYKADFGFYLDTPEAWDSILTDQKTAQAQKMLEAAETDEDRERWQRTLDDLGMTSLTGSALTEARIKKAQENADSAESESDARRWSKEIKTLQAQLKEEQKREKKENSFLGKAGNLWDTFTGLFERPERAEQGALTDTQKAYQQAAAEDQMYSGFATDPLSAAAFAPVAERRDELAEQVKAENREAGREVYAGMAPEDRAADMTESWLSGRGAGTMAGVAGGLYAADSMFYDNDEIRELTQRKFIADQNLLTTGDQKYREESEALQAQIDEAQRRANENGENGTPLGDAAGMLLDSARGMQATADQQWQDATEDMSEGERFLANVGKTGADVAADIVENTIAPGVGTMRMYLGAGGSGAMEQAGREQNDPDSIATATITRAASAWLSTKLVGGMESAYGQSILGGITERAFANASPAVQAAAKTLLNTEGVEEGLEDILNYAGDLILGLNEEAQLNWDEVKQDALVGYVLGVLTNGLSAGINYNSKARHALAEEAVEFAQSGLSIEEAAEIGKESTKEDIVMKPQPETEAQAPAADLRAAVRAGTNAAWNEQAASQSAAIEGQDQNVTPAPENVNLQDTAVSSQDTAPQAAPASSGPTANATPYEGPQLPGASYGGGDVIDIGGDDVSVHYAVIPASQLNMSNDIYGNVNPNYPAELQPRDRTRTTSQASALKMVAGLKPYRLGYSADGQNGAPVVRSDGVVLSGNLRSIALSEVYNRGGEKAGEYQDFVRRTAANFGIDPNTVPPDGVLVRVVDGEDHDWQKLAKDANVATTTKLSATEQATVDSERLLSYPELMSSMVPNDDGNIDTAENKDFINAFLQDVIPSEELNDVWDNKLTQNGEARIKYAIFQTAYGDADLMKRLSESRDDNMKNVSKALLAAAPKVASLEHGVQNGTRYIGVRQQILDGVKLFERAKEQGTSVENLANQASMDAGYSAETVFIAKFLEGNKGSPKQIRTFLSDLADTAESYGDPQANAFFGEADIEPSSRDVLEGAIAKYEQETGKTIGRPDYDFYGTGENLFDLGADRTSESGASTETDTDAGSPAENPGEAAGSGADARVSEEPEPTTEPATGAQENPEEVNSQPEETNSNTDVLNAQETVGNENSEQNGTGTRRTGTGNTGISGNADADFDALVNKNGAIEAGEDPARDINVPRKDTYENKVGEGVRTIMEAEATPESRLGNLKAAVVNGDFGHVPVTNDTRSKNAAAKIARDGWKKSVGDFLGAVNSGKSDPDTIALGAHLLNEAGNSPEATGRDYVELAMAYNEAMTRAGQGLAAGRILKTLTPEGKLYGFEKTVEKINRDIRQKNEKRAPARQKPEVKLNGKLVQDFLNAKTDAERDAVHDKMVKDVAQQVPNTLRDKFTALRYLNMLGNLKTQVRNVVGNVGMSAVQKTKNELVSVMEGIAEAASGGKYKRQYKGFYGTGLLRTARADFGSDEMLQKAAKGEAKYSDVGKQAMADIQDAKDPFSNKWAVGKFLNLYSKITNAAMEYGDLVFVRANYADALAGYLNAHNISSAQWEAMVNDPSRAADVDKARNYAIKQAQEATFRDTNSVSKFVSTMDKDFPKLAKAITQGVIPFRKTPANVLVRMEEYSPLGLVNTAVNGVRAAQGEASASDVIDSMAKTITGTGLAALGFFLRSKGWVRTKDKDDKEEALAKLRGSQDYSVEFTLPNGKRKSFTLDWLTPASGSFFMGAELFDIVDEGGITPANAMTVLSSFTNPMLEMSMLSGVNDALSNLSDFNGDNSAMAQFVLNSAWSYLTQGISNTLAGQAEQFNEAYRQTYYTDSDNPFLPTSVQKKLAKLGNKTPGTDYQAADYIDAWGRKQKNDENLGTRAFNVFANPGYVSNMDEKTTEVDDLLADLYQFGKTQTERDDFPDVVPKTPSRSTTVNGEKLTPEEYDLYATTKGREALDAVTEFSKSDTFRNMDKFAQAETISDIYSYSAFLAASRVAESRGETYYDDKYSPLIRGVDKNGDETYKASVKRGDVPEYLAFKNAYDSAMDKKDYDVIDALLDSADRLPASAMEGAIDRENKMGTLMELKDAGLSGAGVYYQFQDDMKNIYEGEKRTAPKSSDYIRAAGSGRYSPQDADAIMNYETTASEKTVAKYQDQVRYNLEMAGMGGNYSEVWHMVQSVADGDMTKDQLKSYVERNLPIEYRQAIRDVASNYAEDRHVAGKTVSGIYRAAREAGATPKEALEFYNMIDTNYNGYYTKKEFDAACRQMFGTGETGRQVRAALQDYVGK